MQCNEACSFLARESDIRLSTNRALRAASQNNAILSNDAMMGRRFSEARDNASECGKARLAGQTSLLLRATLQGKTNKPQLRQRWERAVFKALIARRRKRIAPEEAVPLGATTNKLVFLFFYLFSCARVPRIQPLCLPSKTGRCSLRRAYKHERSKSACRRTRFT